MKRIVIVAAAIVVVALLVGVLYAGVIPGLSLFDIGTTTKSYQHGEVVGNRAGAELLQPMNKKGFILSYMDDGHSETISVRGHLTNDNGGGNYWWPGASDYYYKIYLKENAWSSYELLSSPGSTSMYFSNPNPGKKSGCPVNCVIYDFDIIGNKYAGGAIKAELWARIDRGPWDAEGYKWWLMSSDEAYLYSGYGSLMLPTNVVEGIERPYDTFEIGQTVDIKVETAKGGYTTDGKPWRVTLNEPYTGGITDPGSGGGVVKELFYANDVTNGHFKFVVTADMAAKSMASTDPYSIRIWNTLLPRGTLYVDFLDFIAKAPSEATLSGPEQSKVGDTITIQISASVNPSTQASIAYFRISVIYGPNDVLLPGTPTSNAWLIHTTNRPAPSGTTTVSFIPTKESYITIHAKTFDTEGRGSIRTKTFTTWAYADSEVPDEVIEDEVGEDDYGGGHTDSWLPWDPGGGNWGEVNIEDYLPIILAIAVFIIMLIIAFIPQIPIPYGMTGRMLVVVLGAVLAVLIYWYMGGEF